MINITMTFEEALPELKKGNKILRKFWSSKEHLVMFMSKFDDKIIMKFSRNDNRYEQWPILKHNESLSNDLLANDWYVIDESLNELLEPKIEL